MTAWKNQRGDVPVGCLVGFVVLVLVAVIAMNAVPAQLDFGDFEKRINELADRANRRDYNNARIKKEILIKAKDLNFDVPPENVLVERTDRWVRIRVHFIQEVRFPGYVWVRNHDLRLERPIF